MNDQLTLGLPGPSSMCAWDGVGPAYVGDEGAPRVIDTETGLVLIDANGEWTDAMFSVTDWLRRKGIFDHYIERTPLVFGDKDQIRAARQYERDLEKRALAEMGFSIDLDGEIFFDPHAIDECGHMWDDDDFSECDQ